MDGFYDLLPRERVAHAHYNSDYGNATSLLCLCDTAHENYQADKPLGQSYRNSNEHDHLPSKWSP